jgi:hypothetical protein
LYSKRIKDIFSSENISKAGIFLVLGWDFNLVSWAGENYSPRDLIYSSTGRLYFRYFTEKTAQGLP